MFKQWEHHGKPITSLNGNIGFTYLIITPEGRHYIGQCAQKRWKTYWGGGNGLGEYYAEHGRAGTRRIIIQMFADAKSLDDAEKYLVRITDAKNSPKYYNRTDGGKSNFSVTEETGRLISKALSGRTVSAEARAKMSASAKRRRASPETKALLTKIRTGRRNSQATLAKMSKSAQASWDRLSPEERANRITGKGVDGRWVKS